MRRFLPSTIKGSSGPLYYAKMANHPQSNRSTAKNPILKCSLPKGFQEQDLLHI